MKFSEGFSRHNAAVSHCCVLELERVRALVCAAAAAAEQFSVTAVSIMSACCRASLLGLCLLSCFLQVFIRGEGKTCGCGFGWSLLLVTFSSG